MLGDVHHYHFNMDPSTFLGSAWGMILGVKYLPRQFLDLWKYVLVLNAGNGWVAGVAGIVMKISTDWIIPSFPI